MMPCKATKEVPGLPEPVDCQLDAGHEGPHHHERVAGYYIRAHHGAPFPGGIGHTAHQRTLAVDWTGEAQ
jgi:hypothetical protein